MAHLGSLGDFVLVWVWVWLGWKRHAVDHDMLTSPLLVSMGSYDDEYENAYACFDAFKCLLVYTVICRVMWAANNV